MSNSRSRSTPLVTINGHALPMAVAALLLSACMGDMPTVPSEATAPQLAKGNRAGAGGGPVEETPIAVTFADGAGDAIVSDGLFDGRYEDGACGVAAHFNSTSDDAILDPDASKIIRKDQDLCGADERSLTFDLGFAVVDGGFMNVDQVRTVTTSALRRTQFNIQPCSRLVFDPAEFPGTDHVVVDRLDDTTWHVSADEGSAVARCVDEGVDVEMPFAATITVLP